MKSHISANSQPPPSAKPATAAITGLRQRAMRSQSRVMKSSRYVPGQVRFCISLMSAPAAKAFSDPVMTMAPIASSTSKASRAWLRSLSSAAQSALSACGRLSAISPTLPRVSTVMFS